MIELITVIVILGIVSGVASRFVVASLSAYKNTQERQYLSLKTWNILEHITRQIRSAEPQNLNVSPSGNCLEFIQSQNRICIAKGNMLKFVNGDPEGASISMSSNVSSPGRPFTYIPNAEDRYGAIWLRLQFGEEGYHLNIDRKVSLRNVPPSS